MTDTISILREVHHGASTLDSTLFKAQPLQTIAYLTSDRVMSEDVILRWIQEVMLLQVHDCGSTEPGLMFMCLPLPQREISMSFYPSSSKYLSISFPRHRAFEPLNLP
jgi:hypothetical protein